MQNDYPFFRSFDCGAGFDRRPHILASQNRDRNYFSTHRYFDNSLILYLSRDHVIVQRFFKDYLKDHVILRGNHVICRKITCDSMAMIMWS